MWLGPPWDSGVSKWGAGRLTPREMGPDIHSHFVSFSGPDKGHLGLGVQTCVAEPLELCRTRRLGRLGRHAPGSLATFPQPAAVRWERASAAQPRCRPLGCSGLPRPQAPGGETTRFFRASRGPSAKADPARGLGRLRARRPPRPPAARLGRVPSSRERFLPWSRIQAAVPAVKTGGVSFILAHKVPKGNRGP